MRHLIQIVPYLPPTISGVGDYALILARGLRENHGWHTTFVVANPNKGQTEIEGFTVLPLLEHSANTLYTLLAGHNRVLLQYVGYGYQKRGCPLWLKNGIERWKLATKNAQLAAMFHELFAYGPPWRSSFWTHPIQKWLCWELARITDTVITNRSDSRLKLSHKFPRKKVLNYPVFSNFGEALAPICATEKKPVMLIMGGANWRQSSLTEDLDALVTACRRLDVKEVVEIGPGDTACPELGLPLRKLGKLETAAVGELLRSARYAFMSYARHELEKSGIYAAYAAHGVVPVLPQRLCAHEAPSESPPPHAIAEDLKINTTQTEDLSNSVFSWYQEHRVAVHVAAFANALNA